MSPDFEKAQERVLRRYVDTCEELARSTVLSHDGGMRITFTRNNPDPTITRDRPSGEALRGTTVLFRQLASSAEPASFLAVRKLVGRRIHETRDAHREQRADVHKAWARAHAGLQQGLLRTEADRKVARAINWHEPVGGEDVRPQHLLSLFQYGDLIHWDRRAEELQALASNDFDYATAEFRFIEVLLQLSHFYLGYAVLVRTAVGLPPPGPEWG